jgi:hypothetical protein
MGEDQIVALGSIGAECVVLLGGSSSFDMTYVDVQGITNPE